jgi:hypothetical protein
MILFLVPPKPWLHSAFNFRSEETPFSIFGSDETFVSQGFDFCSEKNSVPHSGNSARDGASVLPPAALALKS